MILDSIIQRNITGSAWDWLFEKLTNNYNERRQQLMNFGPLEEPMIFSHSKTSKANSNLLIDLILDEIYPPGSSAEWIELINKSTPSKQNLLITYLNLDTKSILNSEKHADDKEVKNELRESFEEISRLPNMLLFSHPTQQLATGLWSLDNDHINDGIRHLSKASALGGLPGDILAPYLPNQIVLNLIVAGHCKLALFVHRLFRQNGWDQDYDSIYTCLLLNSNQLIEALKYLRKFSESDYYWERLQNFLEQCSRFNLSNDLNNLRLTAQEETGLSYYREAESVMSSRPVTPCASQQSQLNPSQQHNTRSHQKLTSSKTQSSRSVAKATKTKHVSATSSSATPNKAYTVSVTDSPARNTRSARKKKTTY